MSLRRIVSGLLAGAVALVWAATATASPSGVVISQVYGGGGNSGATLRNDFIELYNAGTSTVDVSGWSVQYASSAGTTWQRTNLAGSIAPGRYYLVQQAQGAGGTVSLPTPDAIGTIAMSATAGKVALVTSQTTLTGGCPAAEDFVGYGTANCFEGSGAAPALSNTTAALRGGDGAIDTDNNASDFVAGEPNPRNSTFGDEIAPSVSSVTPADGATGVATAANLTVTFSEPVDLGPGAVTLTCTTSGTHTLTQSGGPQSYTFDPSSDLVANETCTGTVVAAQVTDQDTNDPPDAMAADFTWSFATIAIVPIGEVQGSVTDATNGRTHRSSFAPPSGNGAGQAVTVQGVIYQRTLARSSSGALQRGFFIQNTAATADGDPTTSDGIFVFTGGFTTLIGGYAPQVGDEVVITGRVVEFFHLTQLSSARLEQVVSSMNDLDATVPAFEADPPDDLAAADRYWERREGMRGRVPASSIVLNGRNVFPTTADAEVWVARGDSEIAQRTDPYARRAFRDPHPLDNVPEQLFDDGNGYRILMGSLGVKAAAGNSFELLAPARTFDTLTNAPVGGVYFSFEKYLLQVEQQLQLTHGVDPAANHPPTAPERDVEQAFADYNVENLYDFRDDPFDGCDFAGNAGCPGVDPPFNYVPASDAEYQTRLGLIAQQIVADLHAPDVLMVQEAEDQDICTVAAGALSCASVNDADGKPDTLQELALRIAAMGGPVYDAAYDRDGADDRGIVAAFLYRTDRAELLPVSTDDPVFGSTPEVDYRGTPLPSNADVQNPKSLNAVLPADVDRSTGTDGSNVYTRAPQVAAFRLWRDGIGASVFTDVYAISNHFSSTPNARVGQRTEQAAYNAAIVDVLEELEPRVISGGDFNVFPRPDDPFPPGHPLHPSDQLGPLYEQGLTNLWDVEVEEAPEAAYSYVFEGQAQVLDHQFVTAALLDELREARTAHVNADFPADYPGDGPRGLSDHDPMVSQYDAAPTLDKLVELVRYYEATGQVGDKASLLLDRIERARRFLADGRHDAYLSQLQALADQARDLAPEHIAQTAADAIAREAELLKELSA